MSTKPYIKYLQVSFLYDTIDINYDVVAKMAKEQVNIKVEKEVYIAFNNWRQELSESSAFCRLVFEFLEWGHKTTPDKRLEELTQELSGLNKTIKQLTETLKTANLRG